MEPQELVSGLQQLLTSIENNQEYLEEYEIESRIRQLHQFADGENIPLEYRAELIAFGFMEGCSEWASRYSSYYGPMTVIKATDGRLINLPDPQQIDTVILSYWKRRETETKHPVLRARYSGLIWDFSKQATGENPNIQSAKTHIESLISVSGMSGEKHGRDIEQKLERAVTLSIRINDQDLLKRARDAVIDFQSAIGNGDKQGYWAMAYRILLENKNTGVTDEQYIGIIGGLEQKLSDLQSSISMDKPFDPWAFESAALPLANFYKREGKGEDLSRIIGILETAFVKASEHASGLLASSWLQHLHSILLQYGFMDKAKRLSVLIHESGTKAIEEMREVHTETTIPKEELEKYLDALTGGDLETALARIAKHFIEKRTDLKTQLHELAKQSPIQFHITRQLQNMEGRVVATIGSLAEDEEGHEVTFLAQWSQMSSFFLAHALRCLRDRYELNAEKLIEFLYKSPIFHEKRKPVVLAGLQAYFQDDHIAAAHILIPL